MPANPPPHPGSPTTAEAELPPTISPLPLTSVPPGYTPKTSAPLIWALRLSPLAVLLKTPPPPEDADAAPPPPYFSVPLTPVPPQAAYTIPTTPLTPPPPTPT